MVLPFRTEDGGVGGGGTFIKNIEEVGNWNILKLLTKLTTILIAT